MTGVKWQGARIVSSDENTHHSWTYGAAVDCQPEPNVHTQWHVCFCVEGQTLEPKTFSVKWRFGCLTSAVKRYQQSWGAEDGEGEAHLSHTKEQAPSLFILCRKKKWKHRSNHIFSKGKISTTHKTTDVQFKHELPSTHRKLQSHPDLRWTHSSQWDENDFLHSAHFYSVHQYQQAFNTLQSA